MKRLLLFGLFCLFALSTTVWSSLDVNSDKRRIREKLNQANSNLMFLDKIKATPGSRKLSYLFITDLDESHAKYDELNTEFEKVDRTGPVVSPEEGAAVERLLSRASRFARHL